MDPYEEHARRRERLSGELAHAARGGGAVRLRKSTSNLFRRRTGAARLDASGLDHVLGIDPDRMTATVEGMARYETIVERTLRLGLAPAVTPELKTITAGGATAGLGIESSSFRYGLVHETVEEMDVLLGDGRVVTCSRGVHADLFRGFANSYGTLGYALRLVLRLAPAQPFVHLTHTRYTAPGLYFKALEAASGGGANFVDGVVFSGDEMVLSRGVFAGAARRTSDYTWMREYWRSVRELKEDWLTVGGYIWRWDTDWFWCSRRFGAGLWPVRLAATPLLLNSRTYQKLMRVSQRWRPESGARESVIQDVGIPVENAVAFLEFLLRDIGITPVWICPFRVHEEWPLHKLEPGGLYVNFGFWDSVAARGGPGRLNRLVERRVLELGGRKALYSSAWYDRETFWSICGGEAYAALKARYDPAGVLPDLFEKCVGGRWAAGGGKPA